jgi:hypothetical protein
MTAHQPESEWIQRMQSIAIEAIDRAGESTAGFQRLLLAVAAPEVSSAHIADELTRFAQRQALDSYHDVAQVNARTLSRLIGLVLRYQADYARGLVSAGKMAAIGQPPSPPQPPLQSDATEWVLWFQRFSAWITDQQVWSSGLYRALVDEAASGGVDEDAVRSHGMTFVRDRLPGYMAEVAEASFDSFCDLLAVTDESVRGLTDAVGGAPPSNEITVDVDGTAGSTVSARLLIENNHSESAAVRCSATPADGFGLVVAPTDAQLAPGDSREVTVYVTLPEKAPDEPVPAGDVTITGHDDIDLTVHVRARVVMPHPGVVKVRVLETEAEKDAATEEQPTHR